LLVLYGNSKTESRRAEKHPQGASGKTQNVFAQPPT